MRRHKMGMVFQNFGLLPHQTVLENIAFPLRVQGIARPEREARARKVIDLVGLQGREGSFPTGTLRRAAAAGRASPALWP